MVGDGGGPTYKKSRRGDAAIDRAVAHVLRHSGLKSTIEVFSPYGYDERQYCSPGFNLPVGLFQRSKHGTIPQYQTSADNLSLIRPEHLLESYSAIVRTIDIIENDAVYCNTIPKCEPQLGKRGLYGRIGGKKDIATDNMAMLWCSICPTAPIPCLTSRNVQTCLSRSFLASPRFFGRTAC